MSGSDQAIRRRRGAALEDTLLEAAWAELADVGYARLSMDGVAARAHTGKQVLYRRWRNRAELVVAAMRHNTGSIVDHVADTGSLRDDVVGVLRLMLRRYREVGPDVLRGLLAEVADLDPSFVAVMGSAMQTILERAAERGEIPTADLSPRVVTLPTDLIRYEMLVTREPLADHVAEAIVDDVFLPLVRS